MHIYFSGIGGTGLGPLALLAHQAGYTVSGSDKQHSAYIHYLEERGITNIHIGQDLEQISQVHTAQPIDWFVYSSAVGMENPDAPELKFCVNNEVKMTKRDELLNQILEEKQLKLLAVAGTHGKTTTTAMAIWLLQQLKVPISWSVGAKIPFGDMGHYEPGSEYFVYEADEYDHNFLAFQPYIAIITGIDYDHADIYPTRESYQEAFKQFIGQSTQAVVWQDDLDALKTTAPEHYLLLSKTDLSINQRITLPGIVNRQDAWQVAKAIQLVTGEFVEELLPHLNNFPGVSRRFEQIIPGLYSDYAHTPPKIRGTLETAHEVAGDNVVVVYEGLHNTRQHFIKDTLETLFDGVKHLYIVPSYLARENKELALLTPKDLKSLLSPVAQKHTNVAELDTKLKSAITDHIAAGDTIVCLSAGGGGSLDEWLRREFKR